MTGIEEISIPGRTARTLCRKYNTFLGKYDKSYLRFFDLDGNPKAIKGFQRQTKYQIIKAIYAKFISLPETQDEEFDFLDFIRKEDETSYNGTWKLYFVKRDKQSDLMGLPDIGTGKIVFDEGVVCEMSDDKFIFDLMNFPKHACFQMTNIFDILNKHLNQSRKNNVIGFFGDSMQSIYDDGVGDLNQYGLTKIIKTQNRRNPRAIINVANKFREDGIKQIPSDDINAPNMENGSVREGCVKFLYGNDFDDFISIKRKNIFKSRDFSDGNKTKELRLTHKYNAEMAGFKDLYDLYNDDLIITLISKIKDKIDKDSLDKDKTLDTLVLL